MIFDCVSCGAHVGGTGNATERWVIEHAVEIDLAPRVRMASAAGLLRLKLAAYEDRGALDPLGSKDLSDIATLLATRPQIIAEVRTAEHEVVTAVAKQISTMLGAVRTASAIRAHVSERGPLFEGIDELVLARLVELAS